MPSLARACVTFGGTVEEATAMAREAARVYVEGLLEKGEENRLRYDPAEVAAACAGQEDLRILPAARNFDR